MTKVNKVEITHCEELRTYDRPCEVFITVPISTYNNDELMLIALGYCLGQKLSLISGLSIFKSDDINIVYNIQAAFV